MTFTQSTQSEDVVQSGNKSGEFDVLETLTTLAEHRKFVLGLPFFASILAAVISLILPPTYTAKTVLMPPQQQGGGGASAILEQLGPLAGMAAGVSGFKSSADMYVAFLQGDTVRDQLIDKFDLMNRYSAKNRSDARKAVEKKVRVTADKKSGLMFVEADDEDPAFAAQLANGNVEALSQLMGKLALSEARQRRIFFEREVDKLADKAFRDIRVQEAVLGGLLKQLEIARIDESKDSPLLQQVDVATPPDRKSAPKRMVIVLTTAIFTLIVTTSITLMRKSFDSFFAKPENSEKLRMMKLAWKKKI
jgi:uncharacterized protein involved in exopolysaccharide biosynthesis